LVAGDVLDPGIDPDRQHLIGSGGSEVHHARALFLGFAGYRL
jgi:hypothetical protein